MARKLLFLLAISLVCILLAAQASADTGLFGAGARFAWNNYSKPILVHDPAYQEGTSVIDPSIFGGPTFGGELQIRPIARLSVDVAIDMGFAKHTIYPNSGNDIESKASFFKFGFLLGVKFYVIEPEVKKAALYLHLAGGKYFASAKNALVDNSEDYTDAQAYALDSKLKVAGKLNSPVVIQLAVGAEFFAAESFSVGADILGIKLGIAKAVPGAVPEAPVYSGDHSLFTMSIYSALTLNFGFGSRDGSGHKSKKEDSEDAWGAAGTSGGAAAATEDGWGGSGAANGGANTNDGWGAQPAGAAPANDGWDAQPAGEAAPPADNSGWEAQPAPEPAAGSGGGGGGSGGGAKPKAKAKAKSTASPSTPPPPPPGY